MSKKNQKTQQPQQPDENQSFELTEEELAQIAGAGTSSGGTGFRYFDLLAVRSIGTSP